MQKRVLGIILAITSAIIYGLMPFTATQLYKIGANEINLSFIKSFSVMIVLFFIIKTKKQGFSIDKKILPELAIASFLGVSITAILLCISYYYIPSGMATTLHFAYPVIVSGMSLIIFKEKSSIFKYIALIFAAGGIFLIFDFSGEINLLGVSIAVLSAFTYSAYILMVGKGKIKTIEPLLLAFYLNLFSAIYAIIMGIFTSRLTFDFSPQGLIITIILSLIVGFGGTTFFQLAINYIGSESAAILSTFEPITSVLVGTIVLHEMLSIKAIIGMLLILTASFIIILLESKKAKTAN